MKHVATLKNRAASALFAGFILGATIGAAQAEGEPTQSGSTEKQTPAGWSKSDGNSGGWLSSIFGSSKEAPAPDQAASAPGWSAPRDGAGSCRHSSDGEEDFMCTLRRIFWGPDRPSGPNRDMDDNVAAGGAGG